MLRSPLAADFQGVHTIVHASSIYGVATVYSIWQIIQTRCGGDGTLHAHWWVVCTEPMVCAEPYNQVETSTLTQILRW